MGLTYISATVQGSKGRLDYSLLVDTGSLYTWLPKNLLEELGIERMGVRRFKTIDGKILEREVGEAKIICLGEMAHCIVVFGEEGDASVMGVTALENLGLEVDPTTEQVRKSEVLAAY